jgi:FKBP-type peptidyl-prolyl cis-trans isomerase FklB
LDTAILLTDNKLSGKMRVTIHQSSGGNMKKLLMAVCIVLCSTAVVIAQDATPLKEQKDKISYSLGVTIGKSMKRDSIDVNPDLIVQGIKDALAGGKTLLTDEEMAETFMALQQDVVKKRLKRERHWGRKI